MLTTHVYPSLSVDLSVEVAVTKIHSCTEARQQGEQFEQQP